MNEMKKTKQNKTKQNKTKNKTTTTTKKPIILIAVIKA